MSEADERREERYDDLGLLFLSRDGREVQSGQLI